MQGKTLAPKIDLGNIFNTAKNVFLGIVSQIPIPHITKIEWEGIIALGVLIIIYAISWFWYNYIR